MGASAVRVLNGIVLAAVIHACAWSDSIVIDGQQLNDVLISKTSAFYYVQIPREGRTINVPIENVDEGTVKINEDAFYRDKLRDEYRRNKELRDAGQVIEVDPAFRAGNDRLGGGNPADLLNSVTGGGGGVVGGMGIRRIDLEQMLSGFGARFQPGPGQNGQPSVVANMGGAKMELIGPPEQLNGMIISASGTSQQVEMIIGQQRMMVSQMSPEATKLFAEMITEAKQSGRSIRSENGVTMELTYTKQGENVTYQHKTLAGG